MPTVKENFDLCRPIDCESDLSVFAPFRVFETQWQKHNESVLATAHFAPTWQDKPLCSVSVRIGHETYVLWDESWQPKEVEKEADGALVFPLYLRSERLALLQFEIWATYGSTDGASDSLKVPCNKYGVLYGLKPDAEASRAKILTHLTKLIQPTQGISLNPLLSVNGACGLQYVS